MSRPMSSRSHGHAAPGSAPSSGFRGDVQGLRAIAVLTVIAGHAGVTFLPGGFVGVDVFFVISGFLISHLLFREVARDGRVSLRDFYARRARRILPAATLVTVVTLAASVLWISVVDALEVVKDALWATFFAANVRFAAVGTDYFAQEDGPSPLQHYWSLAVEEQFYLVWPLVLIACVWLARRRARGAEAGGRRSRAVRDDMPRVTVFWVLVIVGSASFGYGLWLTSTDPIASYFSTPARAWELAVGALTALVATAVAGRMSAAVRALLCLAGLAAIAVACVRFGESTPFPGVAALLPVLGSAAVLLAGAGGHAREPLPIRALGVGPLRVVGDWSYSLYLWHWPLLVLPELHRGEPLTAVQAGLAVAATFVLAALTYRFVETPFRDARRFTRPRSLALYPASVVLVAASCGAGHAYASAQIVGEGPAITVSNSGIEDDEDVTISKSDVIALVQASVVAARNGHPVPKTLRPDLLTLRDDIPSVAPCDYGTDIRELCPRGDTDADRSIVVLGNSHGRMWIPAFEKIATREGYRTYYFVKPNCTGADLVISDADPQTPMAPWDECQDFRDWAVDQIADLDPALVVVSTSGPNPVIFADDGEQVRQDHPDRVRLTEEGFARIFERLVPLADRVVLLRDAPKNPGDPGDCLTTGDPDLGDCMFDPLPSQEVDSDASVRAAETVGIDYVSPVPWLCWQDECPVVIGDTLSYRDRGHISATYAADLAEPLGKKLGIWTD
ncbi:acyltransferase family protein [Nocardioides sp. R-C-SC26]|uniref:acyltransferase family protein n=1 Tax=Nocardioides sp. R-C-SC26 TaxID=2870414 RepID=UPI001E3DD113|nr:acyltransferase family protein [Nocardioides sp. R-C-SC26]